VVAKTDCTVRVLQRDIFQDAIQAEDEKKMLQYTLYLQ
jgi:hypothetical protein